MALSRVLDFLLFSRSLGLFFYDAWLYFVRLIKTIVPRFLDGSIPVCPGLWPTLLLKNDIYRRSISGWSNLEWFDFHIHRKALEYDRGFLCPAAGDFIFIRPNLRGHSMWFLITICWNGCAIEPHNLSAINKDRISIIQQQFTSILQKWWCSDNWLIFYQRFTKEIEGDLLVLIQNFWNDTIWSSVNPCLLLNKIPFQESQNLLNRIPLHLMLVCLRNARILFRHNISSNAFSQVMYNRNLHASILVQFFWSRTRNGFLFRMNAVNGCLLSGVLACLGSVLGKWAFSEIFTELLCPGDYCILSYPIRGVLILAMMAVNTSSMTMLITSMQKTNTSIGFLLNSASNMIFSGKLFDRKFYKIVSRSNWIFIIRRECQFSMDLRHFPYHDWNSTDKNGFEGKRRLAHLLLAKKTHVCAHLNAISAMKYICSDTFSGSFTPKCTK